MSAKIQVEFELLPGSLAEALKKELAKVSGVSLPGGVGKDSPIAQSIIAPYQSGFEFVKKLRTDFQRTGEETEKQHAARIKQTIIDLRTAQYANEAKLLDGSLDAEEKKRLQAANKQIAFQKKIATEAALQNEQFSRQGFGADIGIMGVGRNIEGIYKKTSEGVGKLAGAIAVGAGAFGIFTAAQTESIEKTASMAGVMLPVIGMTHTFVAAHKAAAIAKLQAAAAQMKLNLAMLANPIGIVIASVVALVAIFVTLYNTSDTVRKFMDNLWSSFKRFLGVSEQVTEAIDKQSLKTQQLSRDKQELARRTVEASKAFELESRSIDTGVSEAVNMLNATQKNIERGGVLEMVLDKEGNVIEQRIKKFTALEMAFEQNKKLLWEKELQIRVQKQEEHNKLLEQTNKRFGIGQKEEREKKSKEEKAENIALNNALETAEREHNAIMRELRTMRLTGEIASDDALRSAQLETTRQHKAQLFHIALQHGGDLTKAGEELADAELDIDENKHARLQAEAEAHAKRMESIRNAERNAMFTLLKANTDRELYEAEYLHITQETSEQQHQERIYEIKRAALMKQLALAGMFSKEWLEAMKNLQTLDREHNLEAAKTKEADFKTYADSAKTILNSVADFMNIGKQAAKQKAEEKKRHAESMSEFKGTLMERNKLEREHQERLTEIDKQASADRLETLLTTTVPTILTQLAVITAAAAPAAALTTIASFGAAAAGAAALIYGVIKSLDGFESGGYTGKKPKKQVAGYVHGDEFVLESGSFEVDGQGNLIEVKPRAFKGRRPGITDGMPYPQNITDGNPYGSTTSGKFDPRDITRSHSLHLMQSVDDGMTSGKGSFEEMMRSHSLHLMQSVDDGLANAKKDFEEMMRSHSLHLMQSVDDIVASGGGNGGVNGAILQTLKSIETKTGVVIDSRRNALSSMAERRALARETV